MKSKIIPSLLKMLDCTNVLRPNQDNMQEPPLQRNYVFPTQCIKKGSLCPIPGILSGADFESRVEYKHSAFCSNSESIMGGSAEASRLEQRLHRD